MWLVPLPKWIQCLYLGMYHLGIYLCMYAQSVQLFMYRFWMHLLARNLRIAQELTKLESQPLHCWQFIIVAFNNIMLNVLLCYDKYLNDGYLFKPNSRLWVIPHWVLANLASNPGRMCRKIFCRTRDVFVAADKATHSGIRSHELLFHKTLLRRTVQTGAI